MALPAMNRVLYFAYKAPPSQDAIGASISIASTTRIGVREGFDKTVPRTVFDLERDAEVADIQREFELYKASTNDYVASIKRASRDRVIALVAVILGLSYAFVVSLLGQSLMPKRIAPPVHIAVNEGKVVPIPVPDATKPAKEQDLELLQNTLATSPAKSTGEPLPAGLPAAGRVTEVASPSSLAGAGRGIIVPAEISSKVEAEKPVEKATLPTKTPDSASIAKPILKKIETLFSFEQTVSDTPEPKPSKEPVPAPRAVDKHEPERKKEGPPTESSPTVIKQSFGPSGVIALTGAGVVIYDRDTKKHRLVPVGDKLPDGSTIQSVDTKLNRIVTDKGEVALE
jgi:hypothetical protein